MKYLVKGLQILYCLYAFVMFVAGMLLIFPGVLFAILLGQPKGGNLVVHLARFWSDLWLLLIGIRCKRFGTSTINPASQYVFVANHISYLDVPVIFQAIRKNSFRVLGKMEMASIPLFGSVYKLATILVDRSNVENRAKSVLRLKQVLHQHISIFIFPEGTFNETGLPLKHFYDGAFRVAIETQTAIKPIVFIDNGSLMHYRSVFSLRPGTCRIVVLPEVPAEGYTLADIPVLRNKVYTLMENCIKDYSTLHGGKL